MKKTLTIYLTLAVCVGSAFAKPIPFLSKKGKSAAHKSTVFSKGGASNLPQLTRFFDWNEPADDWTLLDSTVSTYSATGELVQTVRNGMQKTLYALAADGSYYRELSLILNQGSGNWDSMFQSTTYFDAHHNDTLMEELVYDASAGTWNIGYAYRTVYTYNGNNKIVTDIEYEYDMATDTYVQGDKQDYLYNAQGQIHQLLISSLDSTNNYVIKYKMTGIVWHKWDDNLEEALPSAMQLMLHVGGGIYVDAYRSSWSYDSHSEEIQSIEEEYDGTSWVLSAKDSSILAYDADDNLTEKVYMIYDIGSDSYLKSNKREYSNFYTMTGVDQTLFAGVQVLVYPNPATSQFTIEIPVNRALQFELYDMNGKRVYTQMLNTPSNQIEWNSPEGMYFYQLKSSAEVVASGKLMIR